MIYICKYKFKPLKIKKNWRATSQKMSKITMETKKFIDGAGNRYYIKTSANFAVKTIIFKKGEYEKNNEIAFFTSTENMNRWLQDNNYDSFKMNCQGNLTIGKKPKNEHLYTVIA